MRLAWRLAIVFSLASVACLSPQDIEEEQPVVVQRQPPSFDVTKDVTPDAPIVCVADTNPVEFRLDNLQDPTGQTLHARWFVDYQGGFHGIQDAEDLTVDPGSTIYPPVKFDSSLIDALHRDGRPFFLEVVISDGFADSSVEPQNRAIAKSYYAVTYRWTVEYMPSGTPCPESQ